MLSGVGLEACGPTISSHALPNVTTIRAQILGSETRIHCFRIAIIARYEMGCALNIVWADNVDKCSAVDGCRISGILGFAVELAIVYSQSPSLTLRALSVANKASGKRTSRKMTIFLCISPYLPRCGIQFGEQQHYILRVAVQTKALAGFLCRPDWGATEKELRDSKHAGGVLNLPKISEYHSV